MQSKERRIYSYGKRKAKKDNSTPINVFELAAKGSPSKSPSKPRLKGSKFWSVDSNSGSSQDPFDFDDADQIDTVHRMNTNKKSPSKISPKKSPFKISPKKSASIENRIKKADSKSNFSNDKIDLLKRKRSNDVVEVSSSPEINGSPKKQKSSPFKKFLKNNTSTLSPSKQKLNKLPSKVPLMGIQRKVSEELASPLSGYESTPFSSDGEGKAATKVKRGEKKLFTIVRNTKKASECLEDGESQQFMDDLQFLLDGLPSSSNTLSIRCLSALELALKCANSSFRMCLRAHGIVPTIFESLSDAPENDDLAFSTAAIMFMLTRDKTNIDFNTSILGLMFKLFSTKDEPKKKSKQWSRLQGKLKDTLTSEDIVGVENLDLSNLTTDALCTESLLSFTLQRTGEWLKDEIRKLGGLDHVVDTILQASRSIRNNSRGTLLKESSLRQLQRCFKLIENVTCLCLENQKYLLAYKHSSLIESCGRLLHHGTSFLDQNPKGLESGSSLIMCLLSLLRTLLNLTHDCEIGCAMVCKDSNFVRAILWCAFQLPKFVLPEKVFDTLVLSLGLLINLVEHCPRHAIIINSVEAPPWYQSEPKKKKTKEQSQTPTDSLMQLFLMQAEASENANSLTEDLNQTETSLHNASIRMSADGLSLMCGDDLDKSSNADEQPSRSISSSSMSRPNSSKKSTDKANEALKKARKHMEDSLVAAYAALLLGLIACDNKVNQAIIRQHKNIMTSILQKFLSFMEMMTERPESAGFKAVKEVIKMLNQTDALDDS